MTFRSRTIVVAAAVVFVGLVRRDWRLKLSPLGGRSDESNSSSIHRRPRSPRIA
jgi:hypothetical protein